MDILSVLFKQQKRRIGLIVPSVVISEQHTDTLEITQHPVELGASISDHAYKKPAELSMSLGFAGGGSLLDGIDTTTIFNANSGLSFGDSPADIYKQLLTLQGSRTPFDVITGKRHYRNMLLSSLSVTTDKVGENVLMCTLVLREIMISQAQSIMVADKAEMTEGVSTAPVKNTGTKSPIKPNVPITKPDTPQNVSIILNVERVVSKKDIPGYSRKMK